MKFENESIFLNALRSFFTALFGAAGALLGIGLIAMLFVGIFASASDDKQLPKGAKVMPNAEGSRKDLGHSAPVILQIPIEGTIGLGEVTADKIEEVLNDSREGSLKDGRVKGIVLVINSPGGSANDSNIIYRQLKQYKERFGVPIYAYADGLCASGGYYIACAADKIYSSPVSLIGSVGVIGYPPYMNVHNALEKLGVETLTLSAGKGKDDMNSFRVWRPDESESRQRLIDFYYTNFVSVVVENRPLLTQELMVEKYGAGVFPSPQAQEYGYIDESGVNLSYVIAQMAKELGIEDKYQVMQFKTKNWLKENFGSSSILTGKVKHDLALPDRSAVDYIYVP